MGWLDAAARSVRSGASLRQALAEAAGAVEGSPLADDAHVLSGRLRSGAPLDVALADFARVPAASRSATPQVAARDRGERGTRRLVASSLSLVANVGGAPVAALDGLAATVRDRVALRGEVVSLATQARASAVVIGLAPVAFAAVAVSTDARVATFLLASPGGWACLGAGLVLDAAGAWWMARLVGRVTRSG